MIVNPLAHVEFVPGPSRGAHRLRIAAPIRHHGLILSEVSKQADSRLFSAIVHIAKKHTAPEVTQLEAAELERRGLVVPPAKVPALVAYEFPLGRHRSFEEGILDEAPLQGTGARIRDNERQIVGAPTAWDADDITGLTLPSYSTVPETCAERRRRARFDDPGVLASRGVAVLRGFMDVDRAMSLGSYYRRCIKEGYFAHVGGTLRADIRHNEPFTCFLHRQLTPFVRSFARCPVKPSYCYVAGYRPGSVVPKHTDREQCEWTLLVLGGYRPSRFERVVTPWPLWLAASGSRRRSVRLAVGDAVLFRGRHLVHWRPRLAPRHSSVSILFHFVRAGYTGTLD